MGFKLVEQNSCQIIALNDAYIRALIIQAIFGMHHTSAKAPGGVPIGTNFGRGV
jgi:hypothetical protein